MYILFNVVETLNYTLPSPGGIWILINIYMVPIIALVAVPVVRVLSFLLPPFWIVCLLLPYARETVFQLYHGSDMMYEMSMRKPECALLPTQGIFNLSHHIGMVWEQLAFDYAVSYAQWGNGLQHS